MPRRRSESACPVTSVRPLTAERWPDLVRLFGPQGACFGCWCQYWRLSRAHWRKAAAAGNKAALHAQARSRRPPGLLGYDAGGAPVGWVSLSPRDAFPGLCNSRFFGDAPEEEGLWSVVCFFVPKEHRDRGVAEALLAGAVDYARGAGARVLEAYPWDLGVKAAAVSSLYVGVRSLFVRAGFHELVRCVPHRPIMRRTLA